MYTKIVILTLVSFALTACGKKEESSKTSKNLTSTQKIVLKDFEITKKRKVQLKEDLSNKQEFKANINSFEISIKSLGGQISGALIQCSKDLMNTKKNSIDSKFEKDHGTVGNLSINLNTEDQLNTPVHCVIKDQNSIIGKFKFELQKSIIVADKKYAQNLNLGTGPIDILLLESGADIITNGANINLEMNELLSFDGAISTFDEERSHNPVNDTPGISGGKITLKTKTSSGKIRINLIGLDAGMQTKIPPTITEIPTFSESKNGECTKHRGIDSNYKKDEKCFGKKGQKGFKGLTGYPGYNGGNSGSIYLSNEGKSNLIFEINYKPGKGSSGGRGGEGGKGGAGGKGSTIMLTEYYDNDRCPMCLEKSNDAQKLHKYPDGKNGDPGDQGETGPHGKFGNQDESIIDFKDQNIIMSINRNFKNF